MLRIWLTGSIRLEAGDTSLDGRVLRGRQGRLAFALLVTRRGRPVPADVLAETLWSEDLPRSWTVDLSAVVSRLRTVFSRLGLSRSTLVHQSGCYRLDLPADCWVDTEAAATLLARGDAAGAAAIAREPVLPADDAPFLDELRRQLREVLLRALEELAVAGDVSAGQEAVALEPLRESTHRSLMQALMATGNHAAALRIYSRCRDLLGEELGAEPAPETKMLYEAALSPPVSPSSSTIARTAPARALRALPGSVAMLVRSPLVGRSTELARLRHLLTSPGGLVVIEGEAGVGKTRVAAELALEGHAAGHAIVFGRCDEHSAVPYQPFIDVLPEPTIGRGDPDLERSQFFAAVAHRLAGLSPVLLVIDDVHWADPAAALLLGHLIRRCADGVRFLATLREGEASPGVLDVVADLRRDDLVETVTVGGLDLAAVQDLLAGSGVVGSADDLWRATGGNAFFVREMIRHLADTGGRAGIPRGIADAMAARLRRLTPTCRAVLLAGAVAGHALDVEVLERITGVSGEPLLDSMEEAVAARFVREVPDRLDRWEFSHALTRDALEASQPANRRALLHSRTGHAMAENPDVYTPAEIGRHLAAGWSRDAPSAIGWLMKAGDAAMTVFAYEDAADLYTGALHLVHNTQSPAQTSYDVHIALADALSRAGRGIDARPVALDAAALARQLASPGALTRAALVLAGRRTPTTAGRTGRTLAALLDEAVAQLPATDSPLRAEALVRLALELHFDAVAGHRVPELINEARAIGERLGDPRLELLAAWASIGTAPDPYEILATADRIVDGAVAADELELELLGRICRVGFRTQCGDLPGAAEEIADYEASLGDLDLPGYRWWPVVWRGSRALLEGRLDDARDAIEAAQATGSGPQGLGALVQVWFQRVALQRLRGGVSGQLVDEFELFNSHSSDPHRQDALGAWLRWQAGRIDDAATVLADLAARDDPVTPDGNWLLFTGLLGEAISDLGTPADASRFYDRLAPFERCYLALGFGATPFGSVARTLGLLALRQGDRDLSAHHLREALASFEANHAHAWAAVTAADLARIAVAGKAP